MHIPTKNKNKRLPIFWLKYSDNQKTERGAFNKFCKKFFRSTFRCLSGSVTLHIVTVPIITLKIITFVVVTTQLA